MLRGGVSQPRNAGLLQLFHWLGYGKGISSGIPSLFKAWRDAGYLDPAIGEQDGADGSRKTVVTLPLVERRRAVFE